MTTTNKGAPPPEEGPDKDEGAASPPSDSAPSSSDIGTSNGPDAPVKEIVTQAESQRNLFPMLSFLFVLALERVTRSDAVLTADEEEWQRFAQQAIRLEIEWESKVRHFQIVDVEQVERGRARLTLEGEEGDFRRFGEFMIDKDCEWGANRGAGVIVSADRTDRTAVCHPLTEAFPEVGDELKVRPRTSLLPLFTYYRNPFNVRNAIARLREIADPGQSDLGKFLGERFPTMREEQLAAAELTEFNVAFLDGPPGTGKTFVEASILANSQAHHSSQKAAGAALSNNASDTMALATANVLLDLGYSKDAIRGQLIRIGSGCDWERFKEHAYLFGRGNDHFVLKLGELCRQRKDRRNTAAGLRQEIDLQIGNLVSTLQQRIQDQLEDARTVIGTFHAVLSAHIAGSLPRPNLMIIDEASQLGLLPALALASMADNVLVAGDPAQTRAFSNVKDELVLEGLATSLFDVRTPKTPKVVLNQSARMAPTITEALSALSYSNQLVVAPEVANDQAWLHSRRPLRINDRLSINLGFVISGNSEPQLDGRVADYRAADTALTLVQHILREDKRSGCTIAVIAPFHDMVDVLKKAARRLRLEGLHISTVHATQAMEFDHVVICPVVGRHLMTSGEAGKRVINVAVSRAKRSAFVIGPPSVFEQNEHLQVLSEFATSFDASMLFRRDQTPVETIVQRTDLSELRTHIKDDPKKALALLEHLLGG